jgi:hypothetical protein
MRSVRAVRATLTATIALVNGAACNSSKATGTGTQPTGPALLFASMDAGGVALIRSDGTPPLFLTSATSWFVKAAPSGAQAVFNMSGEDVALGAPISIVDTLGHVTIVDLPPSSTGDNFPSFSRDGQWIYFSRFTNAGGQLWRIHPDGSGGAPLTSQNPGSDYFPTASPDGTELAYVDFISTHLRVLTLANGAVVDLNITAHSPQWSPSSQQIAYLATNGYTGPLSIVNADGSDQVALSQNLYFWGIDWSPDGKWIAARNATTSYIELINASTGQIVPLSFTGSVGSPSWLSGGSAY